MNTSETSRTHRFQSAHLALLFILIVAAYFRTAGLFRGLGDGAIFHPDSPKQVAMLRNYLHGHHVVYHDSWFYDGYPYGLNRVDELIIRTARAIIEPLRSWTHPHLPVPVSPQALNLFLWGRVLRVLYGLLTVVLLYAAVRKFGGAQWSALFAALLYALAPLGSTVTHSVTGDIGLDLFLTAALWCAAGYAQTGKGGWFFLYGLFCGLAFSCKYQGGMALWIPAFFSLAFLYMNRQALRTLLRHGTILVGAFILGIAIGTPPLLVNPKITWQDMRINFQNIKNYNMPEGFLDRPLHDRLWHGLSNNLPDILRVIGWGLSVLCFAALIHACLRLWNDRAKAGLQDRRINAMKVAVGSFPFVALLISTAMKPYVQAFHFSYLPPIMAVSAALLLHEVFTRQTPYLFRTILVSIALCACVESFSAVQRETLVWKQDETRSYAGIYSTLAFETPPATAMQLDRGNIVKTFYAEPADIPAFRNRPNVVIHPYAPWWKAVHQLPVPSVPWPIAQSWIFLNGPVLPINDRMIVVPASGPGSLYRECRTCDGIRQALTVITGSERGWWIKRALVFEQAPESLKLGLRTGRWPARYDIRISGTHRTGLLPPHSQTILEIEKIRPCAEFQGDISRPHTWIVELKARAQLGPVWMTILDSPREVALYEQFGPNPPTTSAPHNAILSELEWQEHLQRLKYVEGLHPRNLDDEPSPLCDNLPPLAAGAYVLTADVVNQGTPQILTFSLEDANGYPTGNRTFQTRIESGSQQITWAFEKDFAPYDADIVLTPELSGISVTRWQIKPDPVGLARRLRMSSEQPIHASNRTRPEEQIIGVHFPGIGTLESISVPETLTNGCTFRHTTRWTINPNIKHKTFHEAMVYIHLRNEEGKRIASFDYLLSAASLATNRMILREDVLPEGLPPGTYYMEGGLFSHFSRKRYPFTPNNAVIHNRNRRSIRLADIVIH